MPRESANSNTAIPVDRAESEVLAHRGPVPRPLVRWLPLERPVVGRMYALGTAAAAVALLAVAFRLEPAGSGAGTHRQLGLPRCSFEVMTSLPCPTCGMTTAFAWAVRGRFLAAAQAQVGGLLLALVTVTVACGGLVSLVSGRRPAPNWYRIRPERIVFWAAAGLIAAWAVKIVLVLAERGVAGD